MAEKNIVKIHGWEPVTGRAKRGKNKIIGAQFYLNIFLNFNESFFICLFTPDAISSGRL